MPCQVCEEYTHPKCSKMSNDLVQYLLDETKDGNDISWTCGPCKKVGKYLNNKVKVVAKKLEELEQRIKSVEDENVKVKQDIEDASKKGSKNDEDMKSIAEQVKKTIFTELRERKEKENNLLFHGVPELNDIEATGSDRKKYDIDWISDIVREISVKMNVGDIKFCRRLGEKKNGKVRPILVGMRFVQTKIDCIKNSRILNEHGEESDFFGIYLVSDLTQMQREEEEEMGRQVHRLNAELEPDVALNSEWRLVGPRGEKRMMLGRKRQDPALGRSRGRAIPQADRGGLRGGMRGPRGGLRELRGGRESLRGASGGREESRSLRGRQNSFHREEREN